MSTNPWAQVQGKPRRRRGHAYQLRRAVRRHALWVERAFDMDKTRTVNAWDFAMAKVDVWNVQVNRLGGVVPKGNA